jgi:hypothetical protein
VIVELEKTEWWCYDWLQYGSDHPDDQPPMHSTQQFISWWSEGGGRRVTNYRFPEESFKVSRNGNQVQIDKVVAGN